MVDLIFFSLVIRVMVFIVAKDLVFFAVVNDQNRTSLRAVLLSFVCIALR